MKSPNVRVTDRSARLDSVRVSFGASRRPPVLRRCWVGVVILAITMGLAVLAVPQASATYRGSNGPMLVGTWSGLTLAAPDGGPSTVIAKNFDNRAARFDADGAKVAYSSNRNGVGILRVRESSGRDYEVTTVKGMVITEIAWSPNSKQIAFIADQNEGWGQGLYKVSSAGGSPTLIKSFDVSGGMYIDWHPTKDLLALVYGLDVWTMNSSGGGVTQWTDECIYPKKLDTPLNEGGVRCDQDNDGVSRSYDEGGVRWEASGDSLALSMWVSCDDPCKLDGPWVARLPVGSHAAVPVVAWTPSGDSDPDNPYYSVFATVPSPDGKWFTYLDAHDKVLLASVGGAKKATGLSSPLFDWQPCPNGACPSFRTGTPTSLTLVNALSGSCTPDGCVSSDLVTSGKLTPVLANRPIVVTLQVFRKEKWSVAATKTVKTTKKSTYQAEFKIPTGASKCRVTASFAGDSTYMSSSITKAYRC